MTSMTLSGAWNLFRLLPQLFNVFFRMLGFISEKKIFIRLGGAILPCPDHHRHGHSMTENQRLLFLCLQLT
jgi:hypothetical protein